MNIDKVQVNPDCSILRNYHSLYQESIENSGTSPTRPVKIKILEKLLKDHDCRNPEHCTAEDCAKDID